MLGWGQGGLYYYYHFAFVLVLQELGGGGYHFRSWACGSMEIGGGEGRGGGRFENEMK